jgi:hypothetical protein
MHMSIAETPVPAKAPRKRTAKAAKPEDAGKIKATIHLSPKAFKLLGIHGVMNSQSNSAIVEELVLAHLKRYVVSDRGRSDDQAMLVESEDSPV